MGNSAKSISLMILVMVSIFFMGDYHLHGVKAEITCGEVTYWLFPCISYGVFGGTVDPACCTGVKTALAAAKTAEDIRKKCECVKEGAALIPGLNYTRVNEIPKLCGTTSPYQVTPDVDCSK
ncbi:Plant lipid transfer protein/Par allergen [Corchorus olitorius]|uniref:Plant lipid transfer protein/Par allergen n=1 Tax=Corchorus olitorius TaxID=93759 RepID=A0A1R3K5G9_9ROSI|nr:Plant lipid transfer protein/Par allergen [Corchorus olitorius]